jgi:inosine/xanthosine triphosphate pyrophosphatase family protein
MTRVVFVTPNQGRQAEVRRLLADVELEMSRIGPAVPEGADLEASARVRAAGAFAQLGRACFVENTGFELDGELVRGAELKARLAEQGEAAFCAAHAGRRCVARVVVALAEAPGVAGVRVFLGELVGHFADAPRGEGGYGWDRVFVPDGYQRTLAELGASTYLVNMRHAPYLDLADHLRGRGFGGAFEAHVTVARGADPTAFRAACDALAVKCVLIELPEGEHASQPMTASVHRGSLREVQDEVHGLARALVAAGFEVVRTKIEALARNADIPETDEQAARSPAAYFEYHLKLVLPGAGQAGHAGALAAVSEVCAAHGARLSRNANARRPEGSEERFVTLRVPREGRVKAEARLDALAGALAPLGYLQKGRLREYTVYDSNVALDRGWL